MPVDSRRLQGPENAFSYNILKKRDELEDSVSQMSIENKILDSNGIRRDQRKPADSRKLFMKTGVVSQAKGSAYIEQGNTKVICAVYGPREVQKKSDFSLNGQLFCEFKYAPFSCTKRRGHQLDSEEQELSRILKEGLEAAVCLHQFPKAQVEIYFMVLENHGSALAASFTCASLALSDASIPMYDLVVGASMRQYHDTILLDPNVEEEWISGSARDKNNSNLIIGYMPTLQQACAYSHEGLSDIEPLDAAMKLLIDYCLQVHPIMQNCLTNAVKTLTSEKNDSGSNGTSNK